MNDKDQKYSAVIFFLMFIFAKAGLNSAAAVYTDVSLPCISSCQIRYLIPICNQGLIDSPSDLFMNVLKNQTFNIWRYMVRSSNMLTLPLCSQSPKQLGSQWHWLPDDSLQCKRNHEVVWERQISSVPLFFTAPSVGSLLKCAQGMGEVGEYYCIAWANNAARHSLKQSLDFSDESYCQERRETRAVLLQRWSMWAKWVIQTFLKK